LLRAMLFILLARVPPFLPNPCISMSACSTDRASLWAPNSRTGARVPGSIPTAWSGPPLVAIFDRVAEQESRSGHIEIPAAVLAESRDK
jgi:hypothetical protein